MTHCVDKQAGRNGECE